MKQLITIAALCLFSAFASAQQQLKGRITNSRTGEGIAAVTIHALRNNVSATSNEDGYFVLRLRTMPDSISVSEIGFDSQYLFVPASIKQESLAIKLTPTVKSLQEVVVSTGYQSLPKERATGSFTQISNNLINEQVTPDIISRLEGITNGLIFNRTTSPAPQIEIRGLSTINGPTSPLIVVDNFPYDGDINNINPNDVENITVLKDAAAASIWGTKAGNGVIVITTKKARFNQPLTIDFNANVTVGQKPDLGYIKQMSSNDFINVEQMLFTNGFYNSSITDPSHPALTPVVELLNAAANGTISQADAASQINSFRSLDVRNDFNKYFYRPSVNQQYYLSVKGGSENQSWLVSGGYDNDISNLDAAYDRENLHFQDNFRPIERLQVSTSLYFTRTLSTTGKPGYGDVTLYNGAPPYPYAQFADANGNPLPVAKDYSLSYLASLPAGLLDWKYYPLTDYQNIINKSISQDIVGNLSAAYQLFPFLKASLLYQYERQNSDNSDDQGVGSYYVRNLINEFTQIDGSGNVTNIVPIGGVLGLTNQVMETQNVRGQLSLNKAWGKNEINAIAGAELRQVTTTGNSNSFYGYNPSDLTFGNVDLTNTYPTYVTGQPAFIPDTKNLTSLLNRFVSLYANVAYTYDSRYTFSVSARRDASNLFGVNTNDKWNPLGSAGLAWDISKEGFYKVGFLPYLRLRATYGVSGNADLSQTAVPTISYLNNSPYTQTPQAIFNTYANPDLKWETVAMTNVAVDFGAFNNRISGRIEYYHKNATNLFGNTPVDYTTGVPFYIVKNIASMQGNGVDLALSTINTTGKLKWQTTINFNYYNDQVTKYYLGDQPGYAYLSNGVVSGVVGKPVYSIFSFPSAGLDPANGNPRGYVNGQVSEDYNALFTNSLLSDLKYNGSALPTKFGSLNNSFSYRNFMLAVNITYKLGYYFRKQSINYSDLFNYGTGNADFAQRWQHPGDELHTYVPSMVYPDDTQRDEFYLGTDPLVEKGDHVRLQYITVSYDFLKSDIPRLPFKSVRLYANASNLGIIWRANKDRIDPDYYYSGNTLKPPLTIAFGAKASF